MSFPKDESDHKQRLVDISNPLGVTVPSSPLGTAS
jgi:hypothetical protein